MRVRPQWFLGLAAMLLLLALAPTDAKAQKKAAKEKDHFDPAVLKDLPDNSWIELGLRYRGGNQVPAVFDDANHLFFKYGGCGDHSPRINWENSKRPNETYGNSCWAVNMDSGKWKMIRPRDQSFPKDRPANGCSRSYVYDSKRKVIWMYSGISNGGGGGNTRDLWTYDAVKDTFTQHHVKNQPWAGDKGGGKRGGDVLVYDSVHDLIVVPRGKLTWIFDPSTNAWQERKTPNGPPPPWHYASMIFDPVHKCVLYPRSVPTGKHADKLDSQQQKSGNWKPTEKGYVECEFQTWIYDPEKNVWTNRRPARSPNPAYRDLFGLAYDSKNQATLLIGGSSNTWDHREEFFNDVWLYDFEKNIWTEQKSAAKKPHIYTRESRHCAYDSVHNVILFLNQNGTLWAYRYRK